MTSRLEEILSGVLRTILADLPVGVSIPDTEEFKHEVMGGLEWWLPEILGEVYAEWKGEAMDGVCSALARKTGDCEIEIFGAAYLMADQSVVPVYLAMQVGLDVDEITWLLLYLGEKLKGRRGEVGRRGMLRLPSGKLNSVLHRAFTVNVNPDVIDWRYKVTFGDRRPIPS